MEYRTIRDILINAEKCFGNEDAIRYKTGKNEIAAKTYTQLKEDSERITALLKKLGDPKSHIALIGATSYLWIASYFGIVDGGNVAVPLDMSLPAEELCELIDRGEYSGSTLYDHVHIRDNRKEQRCDADTQKSR